MPWPSVVTYGFGCCWCWCNSTIDHIHHLFVCAALPAENHSIRLVTAWHRQSDHCLQYVHDHIDIVHYDCWRRQGKPWKCEHFQLQSESFTADNTVLTRSIPPLSLFLFIAAKSLSNVAMGCFGLYAGDWVFVVGALYGRHVLH